MDYGNTKITRLHFYPRRRNVAAQVAEEFKMVTYGYPSYGGTQKKHLYGVRVAVVQASGEEVWAWTMHWGLDQKD